MKNLLAALLILCCTAVSALAQTAITLPIAANAIADLGNGPIKVRMVSGNASIFTSQGSGTGSTSGLSTTLTLTATPTTPPIVGGLISGNGITSGTTVAAYDGIVTVTMSAAMTIPSSTTVSWGAACPSTPPANVIQASPQVDYYMMYTQARVCAVSPGGPVNTLLIEPVYYDQTSPNRGGGGGFVGVGQGLVNNAGIISTWPGVPANAVNTQAGNYTIQTSDCGGTIQAGTGSSGFFTVTIPTVGGFPTNCVVDITNGDTARGKAIAGFSGCSTQNILWPLQTCGIGIVNGAWTALQRPGRWRPPAGSQLQFFADYTNGTDTAGLTDGFASGASAFKTVEHCFLMAADQIDFNGVNQTTVSCNMAPATADPNGLHTPVHALVGAQGGAALQIVGASLSISGAVNNSGCEITVPSTATYSANESVSVYGVNGATGCNGTWKVTVTDGTHLTLQGTTFGGTYTSGGTVTNGSTFTAPLECYFGTVLQFTNVGTLSVLAPSFGCKLYLLTGDYFGGSPSALINAQDTGTQIHFENDIGIVSGATNAAFQAQHGAQIYADVPMSVNFLPGVNPSYNGLAFAYADQGAQISFFNVTINLNGNTVTGQRCQANYLGFTGSNTGAPNTYWPGNSNCTATFGGVNF
jgi:hypothetical protein